MLTNRRGVMHQEMSAGIAEEDQEAEKQSLDGNHSG